MANAASAYAQGAVSPKRRIPETVLITGSLIRGTAAVGVPVTNLSPMDFKTTGRANDLGSLAAQSRNSTSFPARWRPRRQRGARNARQPAPARYRLGAALPDDGLTAFVIRRRQRPLPDRSFDFSFDRDRSHRSPLDGASATYGSDAIAA